MCSVLAGHSDVQRLTLVRRRDTPPQAIRRHAWDSSLNLATSLRTLDLSVQYKGCIHASPNLALPSARRGKCRWGVLGGQRGRTLTQVHGHSENNHWPFGWEVLVPRSSRSLGFCVPEPTVFFVAQPSVQHHTLTYPDTTDAGSLWCHMEQTSNDRLQ